MLRTVKPASKRIRKKNNTVDGFEPRTKRRISRNNCEICHRQEATMVCEICGKSICGSCSDVAIGDIDDFDTYVLMCDDCMNDPDAVLQEF